MTKEEILSKLNELKPELYREFSVKEIGIFGSFVTGDENTESDIDILVELERPIGWKYFTLESYLEKIFERKIDVVTKNALKDQLKQGILNQVNYA